MEERELRGKRREGSIGIDLLRPNRFRPARSTSKLA